MLVYLKLLHTSRSRCIYAVQDYMHAVQDFVAILKRNLEEMLIVVTNYETFASEILENREKCFLVSGSR